jgi:nicotinate-nucleotide adenylyltransferase
MSRIGYYGGTFDPVHFGHLNVCYSILEANLVDQIFIIPTAQNPRKEDSPQASFEDRMNMLHLAFDESKQIKILDIENKKGSYTIDSITFLQNRYENSTFRLIIGSDQAVQFIHWKEYQVLIEKFHPLVVSRFEVDLLPGMTSQKIPLMEISSSDVRERIKNKQKIDHLVPAKVVDYIYFHHLYSSNFKEKKI